jgi:hypothetical protein
MHSPRVNVPDNLFDQDQAEDDSGGGEPESFEERERPTSEFLKLVGSTREKMDRRRAKPKTMAAAVFNRALAEVDQMLRSGVWDGASARHLVALYDVMHQRAYGVAAAELGPAERYNAGLLAGNMLKREFGGDLVDMVNFMLWAWQREIEREAWRRENGRDGGRIGVRLMFNNALLTDYRIHLARRGRRT